MNTLFLYFQVIFYCSYAYLYLWERGFLSIKPLYWYIFTVSCGAVLVMFKYGFSLPPLQYRRLLLWCISFVVVSTFSTVFVSGGVPAAMQQLILYVEGVSILFIIALLIRDYDMTRRGIHALLVVVIASVIINYIDFFKLSGLQFSDVAGRAAGMYGNPNISGRFLVLGMAISVFVLPKKWRFIYSLFVLSGVMVTFSRSSIMMWAVVVIALTWFKVFLLPRAVSFVAVTGFVMLFTVLLVAGLWMNIFESLGIDSYLDKNTQARISGSFIEQDDYSSRGRLAVALKGINLFLSSPLVGKGIGSGNDIVDGLRAHNTYIQMAAEQGILGLAVFVALIWLVWKVKSSEARVFIAGFAGFSLFTHNMLDQPAMYVMIVLAVSRFAHTGDEYVGVNGNNLHSTHQRLKDAEVDQQKDNASVYPRPQLKK